MTKAHLVNVGPPIPSLGSRQPRQRGAGGIEALSSFISAQALDHSCSPYTLFSSVLIPSEEKLNIRWRRVRWGESQLINSYGEVAAAIADAVESCTGISKVRRMTLNGLQSLCDPRAKHLMHSTRPWCPDCYMEARAREIPAWDPLYSYVRTSKVCVWHKRKLVFCCAKCGLGQRYLPKFPFLDFCEHCGADLAKQGGTPLPEEAALDEANFWIARAALDMLASIGRDQSMSAANFARNVRRLMDEHFRGKEQPFALRLGLAGSSPKNWVKRGSAPTWASLVDLGYRLDIPPAQLCSPESPLTDPQYWRQLPAASLDKPHVRPSAQTLTRVRSELTKRLELPDVGTGLPLEGLPRLAKRLQVSLGVLKRNFPGECARLIGQRLDAMRARRVIAEGERAQRMSTAVAALSKMGLPLTSRNLKQTGHLKVSDVVSPSKPAL